MVSDPALEEMSVFITGLVKNSLGRMTPEAREAVHKESWFTTMKRDRATFKTTMSFEETLLKLKKQHEESGLLTDAEIAVLECLHYLVNVEGPLQTMSAQLCLYAVKAGLKFEVKRGKQIVQITTGEAVQQTSMDEKLAFLAECGARVPPGTYNRKLRNSVAHMDFSVDDDGTISYGGERIAYLRVERLAWSTRDVFVTAQRAIAGVVGEFLRRDGWRGHIPKPLPPLD
jgi:hypothetical protein